MEGEHIKGSPFTVTVKLPVEKLGTPIKTITGVSGPWGVAVNQRGEIIVAESTAHCISIFSPTGEKLQSFSSRGSGPGQFNEPTGVAVDGNSNILVMNSCCIQKFTSKGKFITKVGTYGNGPLQFLNAFNISIHPSDKKIFAVDRPNHRIQILNPDLTFYSSFGSHGSGNGQFTYPWDVAFDSAGNVYVSDSNNHCIQVFTAEGQFLKQFGKKGSGRGELNWPSSITIDSDNMVYVTENINHRVSIFTTDGQFLRSFGTMGTGQGQFNEPCGITIDKRGLIYVSDHNNARLQLF